MIASASCPVRFSSSARYDEESESPIMPVCGDRAATAILLEVVIPVPANGDVAKMRGLFGTERVRARRAEAKQEQTRQPDAADDLGEDLRR